MEQLKRKELKKDLHDKGAKIVDNVKGVFLIKKLQLMN